MVEQNKLLGLEVLRFLTACIVVFAHYHFLCDIGSLNSSAASIYPFYKPLLFVYYLSNWPVRIFWCISGFIFFWKYQSLIANNGVCFKDFFISRFARLYPLHFLTLIIVAVGQSIYFKMTGFHYLNDVRYTVPYFVSHLFMASNRVSNGDSFNWPIWSVCLEVSVYLLFFAVTRYATRSVLFNFFVVALFLFVRWAMPGVIFMVLFECLLFFYIGGIAAILKRHLAHTVFFWSMLLGVVLIPFFFWLKKDSLTSDTMYLFWCLWLPFLLFCAAQNFDVPAYVRKIIETLGNMTYASYLIHIPLQLMAAIICYHWKIILPLHHPLSLIAYFAIVLFFSYITYRYFEFPLKEIIKRRAMLSPHHVQLIFVGISVHLFLALSPIVELWDKAARAEDSVLKEKQYAVSGKALMLSGKYLEAIAAYQRTLERYPNNPEDYINLAQIYFRLGRDTDALVHLEKAIVRDPDYIVAYNTRGVIYDSQKKYDLALEDFSKAISLDPCERLFENGRMELYRVDKKTCEGSSRIHFNLASIYLSRKDYTKAIIQYNQAIAMDPNYAKAYADRSVCYFHMKDHVRFRQDARRAAVLGAKLNPTLLKTNEIVN